MAIARQHRLNVIEDACQAHLAEYQGKQLETIGDLGCFSFQSSKTIACGEGGAVIGNDTALMDRCYTVHNHGTSRLGRTETIGPKYRMREEMACPNCDRVCEELVMLWASGPLLGSTADMNDVINALYKVYENRDALHRVSPC